MFEENKELIASYIYKLLKHTRFGFYNLTDVRYVPVVDTIGRLEKELLIVDWRMENGNIYSEEINVTCDSGMAMIIDLAEWLKTK